MTYAILGGTLDDLQDIYKLSATGVSQILVTRSAGSLVGMMNFKESTETKMGTCDPGFDLQTEIQLTFALPRVLPGRCFLYKHMNGKLIIVLSLLLGGLGTIIVPDLAPDFWIAHFGQFVTGFSYGTLEVGELGHTAIRCLPLK